jgi:cell fate regulator YaaT (PSP1 superfamily)
MNFQLLIESLSEGFQFQIGVRPPSVWEEAKHSTDICPNGNFLCCHTVYTHLEPNSSNFTIHLKSYFRGNALYR